MKKCELKIVTMDVNSKVPTYTGWCRCGSFDAPIVSSTSKLYELWKEHTASCGNS